MKKFPRPAWGIKKFDMLKTLIRTGGQRSSIQFNFNKKMKGGFFS